MAASRNYVCVRPQTYENEAESGLLKSLFRSRSGELENTVFCVLASDGKTKLCRSGRSPAQVFDGADALAQFLDEQFQPYHSKARAIERLPLIDEFALALNVASCDGVPLVILRAESEKDLAAMEKRMAELAWSEACAGQQHYFAFTGSLPKPGTSGSGFAKVGEKPVSIDFDCEYGITALDPGPFGLEPKTLAHARADTDVETLTRVLGEAQLAHDPTETSRRQHGREARRQGITWESELPATDGPRGRSPR
ncbi:hypothetical protein Poly30_47300 [Planctomycetes bacterium Poly30]|uniref:Uncharacterized protein n=1 Tax=Saltatorellus ferox TaxID=2528018 RepID=A0A518EYL4_9BACT|nr:hypothetical protein Poly30_47300 [Planctomycetes bacterium Poly30]